VFVRVLFRVLFRVYFVLCMCSAAAMELLPIRNGTVGDWRLPDHEFLASFKLPGPEQKHDVLKDRNPFPRDGRITFDEDKHEYTIDNSIKVPRSVTGLVHQYVWPFDPHAAVRAMKQSIKWEEKRHAFLSETGEDLSDNQIIELWTFNGRIASARGTLLHWHGDQSKKYSLVLETQRGRAWMIAVLFLVLSPGDAFERPGH